MKQKLLIRIIKLSKPEIAILLDMVAVSSFLVGMKNTSQLPLLVPLLISGTMSSFSASIFNSIIEGRSDKLMKRTSWRDTDQIKGILIATGLFFLIASISVAITVINLFTTIWIISGFISYVLLYTVFLKRRTSMNIVIGGISGSFPALAGWSTVSSPVSIVSIYLAVLIFLWTPIHFWSLAIKYKDDYRKAGIPMLPAIRSVDYVSKAILANMIALLFYIFIPFIFPRVFKFGILYLPVVIISSIYLIYNYLSFARLPVLNSIRMFTSSNIFLLILLIGFFLQRFMII